MEDIPRSSNTSDRLVDFRYFNEITGSRCKTSHTARQYAKRGLIRAVRLNARVLRYSEASIRQFIANATDGGRAA